MARIPHRVVPETQPSARPLAYLDVPRNPAAFGAGIGAALGGFGEALGSLGGQLQERQERTDRFGALRAFSEFQLGVAEQLTEVKRATDPGTANFPEIAETVYQNAEGKFLSQLPPDLQEEFSARTGQVKQRIMADALDFQYKQQDAFFRQGVGDAFNEAKIGVSKSPGDYEQWLGHVFETIDAADIPAIEKANLQRETQAGLASILYLREAEELSRGVTPTDGTVEGTAAALIRDFEDFRSTPYWDVNAYRGGFGSDTVTLEDGSIVKVTPGMQVSEIDAERDLARRIRVRQERIVKQVGLDNWAKLPSHVQSALISVTDNYGSLPASVVGAVREADKISLPAVKDGVTRYYTEEDLRNTRFKEAGITPEAANLLDRVTEGMGKKLSITSAFRSEEHNRGVGGATGSQHLHGNAVDISTSGLSEAEKARLVALAVANGATGIGYYKGHIHIDSRPSDGGTAIWPSTRPEWFDLAVTQGRSGEVRGSLEPIAQAVAGLSANPQRRAREAAVIRGQGLSSIMRDDLDEDQRFALIPYEDRLALRADADRKVRGEQAAIARAQREERDSAINTLLIAIDDGQAGEADIAAAIQSGLLDDFRDRKRVREAFEKKYGDALLQRDAQAKLIDSGAVWEPSDSDDRKRLNALVDKNRLREMDKEYVTRGLVPLVQRTGDIPTDAVSFFEGLLGTKDRSKMLFALDSLAQMQDVDSLAFKRRVGEALASDVAFWRTMKDYYNEEEIIESLRHGNTQEERQAREYLAKEGEQLLTDIDLTAEIVDSFDSVFTSEPEVVNLPWFLPAVQQEFASVFVEEYTKYRNKDLALEATKRRVQNTWGVSALGGRRTLMKFPPETVYKDWPSGSGDYSWIDEEVRRGLELDSQTTFQVHSDEVTKSEYEAFRRGGDPPSYMIVVEDENGVGRVMQDERGDSRRFIFELPEEKKALEQVTWDDSTKDEEFRTWKRDFDKARMHSLWTGTPIPQDMLDEEDEWREYFSARRNREQLIGPTVEMEARERALPRPPQVPQLGPGLSVAPGEPNAAP